MKATRILTLTSVFFLAVASLSAQDTVTMNLKECMRYAVEHSTKVRIQEADNRDAQIDRRDAILSAFTPQVSGSTYAYSNFGRSIDPETNTYIRTTSFHNGYSLSAGMYLFNGFQAVNNLKITKTAQLMGLTQAQQLEDQICLATMEVYCNVLYYNELEKALQNQVATAEKAVQRAERQEQLGQKSHADVVQMQADLADRHYQLTTCRNNLANAFITLKDVMFWPIEVPLKIDESFSQLPQCDSPTNETAVGLSHRGSRMDESEEISQLLSFAKTNTPSILLAEGRMKNARLSLKTARWQLLPTLALYGGWSSSYFTYPGREDYVPTPFMDQIKNNGGEYIQLSLSIPIFDRLSSHSNIAKKKNVYERAQAEYEQTLQTVEAEVRRAVADRDGTADALLQAEARASLQQEAYTLNAKQFEQGLISSIEYQTASNNYLNALAEQLNARLQYFIKNSVVTYYGGTPYLLQ
ncbi:MAG: TolC family protein [Bacteroidales bacterium]|nr:TolC family protein [Bacteroidales bacterium]